MGSMLVVGLSPKLRMGAVPAICLPSGPSTHNLWKMGAFHDFYTKLYSGGNAVDQTLANSFLDSLPISKLEDQYRNILEAQISSEEVTKEVIKHLKWGSAPEPEGFSIPYYKAYIATLSPYLARFFNSLRQGASLERSQNSAYLTIIPKPGKDPIEVSNYCPISLINNDLKILTRFPS